MRGFHLNYRETVTSPKPHNQVSGRSRNRTEKALIPPHMLRPQGSAALGHNDRSSDAARPLVHDTVGADHTRALSESMHPLLSRPVWKPEMLGRSPYKHQMITD